MTYKLNDFTRDELVEAAKDLNKVLEPDPPIKFVGVKKEETITGIKEAAKLLEPTDEILTVVAEVLDKLGLPYTSKVVESKDAPEEVEKETEDVPEEESGFEEPEEKDTEETEPEPEPEGENQEQEEEEEEPEPSAEDATTATPVKKYSRAQAFCDALKGKPKTLADLASKMDEIHCKNNPKKKPSKQVTSEWVARDYLQPLIVLGIVEVKDKKYSLK